MDRTVGLNILRHLLGEFKRFRAYPPEVPPLKKDVHEVLVVFDAHVVCSRDLFSQDPSGV